VQNAKTGNFETLTGDYLFSLQMPVTEINFRHNRQMYPTMSNAVDATGTGFIVTLSMRGVLVKKVAIGDLKDHWDLYTGKKCKCRMDTNLYNNWRAIHGERPGITVWLGLEYFC
jgi:hypothetical protein